VYLPGQPVCEYPDAYVEPYPEFWKALVAFAEHGKSLKWMKQIKALFDPNGILNPGKIFP
jgi:FAD/FMN-containing dehydrogenase